MDRKSRFIDKYIRKLPGTERAVTLVFNEIQARILGVRHIKISTSDYFYGLRPGILLMSHSNNLSASLQTNNLCAADVQAMTNHTVATFKKMRMDKNRHLFWEDV